ncbi:MAG TPA: DUF72 domain-containing protein [Pyrinomonadaceae bacterium]|nr:DUF72 domain-containing protein [Pyrinomonadaceae bacterium]
MLETKQFHIGCQSWQYEDWVSKPGEDPVFYPRGTRPADMLSHYSQIFDTIEVDSTAYGTPAISTLEGWVAATPDDFRFSLKVPRAITHDFSLTPQSYPLMDEFTDAARLLGKKLGAVLIQLPASFESTKDNGTALRAFVSRLPRDIRFAVEFRHPGWFVEWTFDELNENRVALGLVAGKWVPEDAMLDAFEKTHAPIAYVRMMGIRDLDKFDRIYRDRSHEIGQWAAKAGSLKAKKVFVYLDNYFEGHAPATANRFKAHLGIPVTDPQRLDPQASLF